MSTLSTVGALGGMAFNAGSVYATLHLIDQPFYASLASANKALAVTTLEIAKRFDAVNNAARGVQNTFGGLAAISAVGVGAAIYKYAQFEEQMRNVNSISKLNVIEFKNITESVRQLSNEIGKFSSIELSQGLYQIASSGFYGADGLKILKESSVAAAAGLARLDITATAIVGVINAYGLAAKDAQKVSDILFKTVDLGIINFNELAQGIGAVAALSAQAKIPLETVGAMIATVTRGGFVPAEALTRIERFIQAVTTKPSEDMLKFIKMLGFESGTEALNKLGPLEFINKLNEATKGKPELFGQLFTEVRALQGALSLAREQGKPFGDMLKGFGDSAGSTAKAFKEQSKSLIFDINASKEAFSNAAIVFGGKFSPTIRELTKLVREVSASLELLNADTVLSTIKFSAWTAGIAASIGVVSQLAKAVTTFVATGPARVELARQTSLGIVNTGGTVQNAVAQNQILRSAALATAAKKAELIATNQLAQAQGALNITQVQSGTIAQQNKVKRYESAVALLAEKEALYQSALAEAKRTEQLATQTFASTKASAAAKTRALNTWTEAEAVVVSTKAEYDNAAAKVAATSKTTVKLAATIKNTVAQEAESLVIFENTAAEIANMDSKVANTLAVYNSAKADYLSTQASVTVSAAKKTESLMRYSNAQAALVESINVAKSNLATTQSLKNLLAFIGLTPQVLSTLAVLAPIAVVIGSIVYQVKELIRYNREYNNIVKDTTDALQKSIDKTREEIDTLNDAQAQYKELRDKKSLNIDETIKLQTAELKFKDILYKLTGDLRVYTNTVDENTAAYKRNREELEKNALAKKVVQSAVPLLAERDVLLEVDKFLKTGAFPQTAKARDYVIKVIQDELAKYLHVSKITLPDNEFPNWFDMLGNMHTDNNVTSIKKLLENSSSVSLKESSVNAVSSKIYSELSARTKRIGPLTSAYTGLFTQMKPDATFAEFGTGLTKIVDSAQTKEQVKKAIADIGSLSQQTKNPVKQKMITDALTTLHQRLASLNSGPGAMPGATPRNPKDVITEQISGFQRRIDNYMETGDYELANAEIFSALQFIQKAQIKYQKEKDFAAELGTEALRISKIQTDQKIQNIMHGKPGTFVPGKDQVDTQFGTKESYDTLNNLEQFEHYELRTDEAIKASTTPDNLAIALAEGRLRLYERFKKGYENAIKNAAVIRGPGRTKLIDELTLKLSSTKDKIAELEDSLIKYNDDKLIKEAQALEKLDRYTPESLDTVFNTFDTLKSKEGEASLSGSKETIRNVTEKIANNLIDKMVKKYNSGGSYATFAASIKKLQDKLTPLLGLTEYSDLTVRLEDAQADAQAREKDAMEKVASDAEREKLKQSGYRVDTYEDLLNSSTEYKERSEIRKNFIKLLQNEYNVMSETDKASTYGQRIHEQINSAIKQETSEAKAFAKEQRSNYEELQKAITEQKDQQKRAVEELEKVGLSDYESKVYDLKRLKQDKEVLLQQVETAASTGLTELDLATLKTKIAEIDIKSAELEDYFKKQHPERDYLLTKGKITTRKQLEYLQTEQGKLASGVKDPMYWEYQKQIDAIKKTFTRTDIGDAIWDISRDKNAIDKYVDTFVNRLTKKHYDAMFKKTSPAVIDWWNMFKLKAETETTRGGVLGPSAVNRDNPMGGGFLGKIYRFGKKVASNPAAASLIDVYAGYQNIKQNQTTSSSEGLLSGGLTGASTGASIAQVMGWANPLAAIISGAVIGGLFGQNQAKKNAEEEANRVRKQMLEKLNDIDNHIKPVSDYFNRGGFGVLTQAFSFGGGLSTEMGWAIDTRRGVR